MKKIYFAGKFNINKDKSISLADRLKDDYRSIILDSATQLTFANDNLMVKNNLIYVGPFYCEQASNGNFTSTDCNVVIESEYEAVNNCDIYFAVFDENFSVGTIVELTWAVQMNKKIIIFYKEEDSDYEIKSEYWFAIADAIKRGNTVRVYRFNEISEVINKIKEGRIFDEV